MKNIAEAQLLDRSIMSGDQLAFAELVKRHQSGLRYSLRQLTRWDEALADDLAQETFIRAYQKLHSFRGDAKFSSWLYRIGYNLFLQHCRKKQLDTEELHDERHSEPAPDVAGAQDTDLQRAIAEALATLSPEARSVMHLSLHRQCTQQEISTIMGIPLGTVKTHINRSKPLLQAQLGAWRE
ncbi:MAG: sigma-70 family RNA polymerase sigma factor [Gammaproteobacteria bacterium]|nr:sigma-70 family RNA polymerase sigma factor [Gammaproteobacteria bacterium]